MKISIKNVWLVLKDQMPLKRFIRNFFITRNGYGLFYKTSHIATYNGKVKIGYSSHASALKAALSMEKKNPEKKFSAYKCLWCDKYHIGGKRNG